MSIEADDDMRGGVGNDNDEEVDGMDFKLRLGRGDGKRY